MTRELGFPPLQRWTWIYYGELRDPGSEGSASPAFPGAAEAGAAERLPLPSGRKSSKLAALSKLFLSFPPRTDNQQGEDRQGAEAGLGISPETPLRLRGKATRHLGGAGHPLRRLGGEETPSSSLSCSQRGFVPGKNELSLQAEAPAPLRLSQKLSGQATPPRAGDSGGDNREAAAHLSCTG